MDDYLNKGQWEFFKIIGLLESLTDGGSEFHRAEVFGKKEYKEELVQE